MEAMPRNRRRWVGPLIVLGVLLLIVFIRVRLKDIPLERDEGEYAYAGQLILQGIPPYKLAYNMKLPGTYAAYAVILFLFGQTPAGIHLGLMLVNAATTILMFFLAKRLFGELAAVVAAAAYALLSTGAAILGLQAHATHFVVLAAVAGLLLFVQDCSVGSLHTLFWSGMLFGVAFVMKQPGLFFSMFAGLLVIYDGWRRKQPWNAMLCRVGIFGLGVVLPFALTCALMALCGVFPRFWFWVFDYARAYGWITSIGDGLRAFENTAPEVVGPASGIWVLALVGATAFSWDRTIRRHAVFGLGLLLFSFLAVCPGLYFRPHYFILMLPTVALLAAVAVDSVTRLLLQPRGGASFAFVPALVFLGAFGYALVAQGDILFEKDALSVCRFIYPGDPFSEALQVADYIDAHTDSTARIAVLGSEPEIYFYSRRHSATGYIYSFALSEHQPYAARMQQEMFAEVEAARPEYLVVHPGAWFLARSSGIKERLAWANGYVLQNYEITGIVDQSTPDKTEFHWDQEVRTYHPRSVLLYVLRKKRT